mmetsp:Transcript_29869/g.49278  ORF Transcript_29869/g.49278 Transcript_29869/m.49278 type:complete len:120 (+) Transcript_29869:106-465(+)
MGNCCGGEADESDTNGYKSGGPKKQQAAFQGEGHRLGSADEVRAPEAAAMQRHQEEEDLIPEPIHNPNLTDADREKQRADRLAAVEARMKAKQPKKPKKSSEPLRGPNTKPTMTWSAAN